MIGEIRDAETAQMAAQSSLIGTLIFSTFHTFDIPALIMRLQEMGISNSIIAQALKGVVSTRLLRKICASCKTEYQATPEEKNQLGIDQNIKSLYKGKGCDACQNLGYLGRIGIYEITSFDEDIKDAIIENKPASHLSALINKKQPKKLRNSAVEKVARGITTIDEVIRVLGFPLIHETKVTPANNL
jgi:type IV pilus assembly protein PilB